MLFMLLGMGVLFVLGFSVCYAGVILIIEEQIEQQTEKMISLSIISLLGLCMLVGLVLVLYRLCKYF